MLRVSKTPSITTLHCASIQIEKKLSYPPKPAVIINYKGSNWTFTFNTLWIVAREDASECILYKDGMKTLSQLIRIFQY